MRHKRDLIALIFFPIFATVVSLIFKTNLLISTLLFFGLPSVYLSLKIKKSIRKTFIFSILSSIPLGILIDYFAEKDGSWLIVDSVFPYRIFGLITIDGLIWLFFMVYFIVIFYEYFLDKKGRENINRKFKIFEIALSSFLIILVVSHSFFNELAIPYFYLILGILLMLLPVLLYLKNKPNFISRYSKVAFYFIYVFLLNELTGLQLNHWTFPGENFIGWVSILNYSIPFEEFLFWIGLCSVSVIIHYEYFADDEK